MNEKGELIITLPPRTPVYFAQRLVDSSRDNIRDWQKKHVVKTKTFHDGDQIGHSHSIKVVQSAANHPDVKIKGLVIVVSLPTTIRIENPPVQKLISTHIAKALQKEARAYLPRRLRYLADQHGFHYVSTRFGTQKGRWGSCSSRGTISLNVALMGLPLELIDYVLVHELCHTRQMNHSPQFWAEVAAILPDYKLLRKRIKTEHP